jgi:hypothetical protein
MFEMKNIILVFIFVTPLVNGWWIHETWSGSGNPGFGRLGGYKSKYSLKTL